MDAKLFISLIVQVLNLEKYGYCYVDWMIFFAIVNLLVFHIVLGFAAVLKNRKQGVI